MPLLKCKRGKSSSQNTSKSGLRTNHVKDYRNTGFLPPSQSPLFPQLFFPRTLFRGKQFSWDIGKNPLPHDSELESKTGFVDISKASLISLQEHMRFFPSNLIYAQVAWSLICQICPGQFTWIISQMQTSFSMLMIKSAEMRSRKDASLCEKSPQIVLDFLQESGKWVYLDAL